MAAFSLQDLDHQFFPCYSGLEKAEVCNNETVASNKWCDDDDSSSVVENYKVEVGEQVQKMEKKRVTEYPFNSSSKSMDGSEVKRKRLKKSTCARNEDKEKRLKKDENKISEDAPIEYVHVRAKRGQATDSHSLAERARREKISERMKILQSLVPGCDKITGKALMLDEIINYVQSLQNQVEFLSLKLASLDPFIIEFATANDKLVITPPAERLNDDATIPIFSDTITDIYPLLDHATSSLLRDPQMQSPNLPTQDDGEALWDVIFDEQRQQLNNEFGFMINNLCPFQ